MADRYITVVATDRRAQIDGMQEMFDWLGERPSLPLPLHGAWAMPGEGDRYGEDGDAFHVFAHTPGELDRLVKCFDDYEDAPRRWQHPVGVRRLFGPVAYEVLLDEHPWPDPLGLRCIDRRPEPTRSKRLAGLGEMISWLSARPDLRLPITGARMYAGSVKVGGDDLVVFGMSATSTDEQDALLALFDRVERWPADQPTYVKRRRRRFSGGIVYEVDAEIEGSQRCTA